MFRLPALEGSNPFDQPQDSAVNRNVEDGIAWFDASDWSIEGKGWTDTSSPYDRLPTKAEKMVRKPVWDLSRHSAGMMTRFATNSNEIRVRYRLTKTKLAMPHMPATGVSGVDLYADDQIALRWIAPVAG